MDACNEVSMELDDTEENMSIHIRYNKGKMLQLAAYSPDYALKRAEGMQEIKKMLREQPQFPNTFLDFFTSNNPIMLKAEIVAEWFADREDSCFMKRVNRLKGELHNKRIKEQEKIVFDEWKQMSSREFDRESRMDQRELMNWLKSGSDELTRWGRYQKVFSIYGRNSTFIMLWLFWDNVFAI